MNSVSLQSERVLLFTDIHYGKSRDSLIKLETADKFIDRLIAFAQAAKLNTILFLGDWYDNRNSISVKTYTHGWAALKRISDAGLTIYLIVGNHDSYFKDNISITSVKPLGHIKNVHIIDELTEINFASGKKGILCPWGSEPTLFQTTKTYDIAFGHFEFSGAQQNYVASVISHGSYSGEKLTNYAPIIFSGHYHVRRDYVYKTGKIVTCGCPFQLDWGDYSNTKGIYVLNTSTFAYEFKENTASPKHIKLYWSKIKKLKVLPPEVTGNYVKLVIDEKYAFEKVMTVTSKLHSMKALKVETEMLYTSSNFAIPDCEEGVESCDDKIVSMSKIEYLVQFIHSTPKDQLSDLDVTTLEQMAKGYYERSIQEIGD